jgi:hypothetical protein
MQARPGIRFRPRALRHGAALLVAAAAMAACDVEEAPTAPGPSLEPALGAVHGARARFVMRASTEAAAGVGESGAEVVRMTFRAELHGAPSPTRSDVVATWPQVGGIEPQPFIVTIPAGCFVEGRRGFSVVDMRGCGVRAELGGQALPLLELEAVMGIEPVPFAPNRVVLRIRAVLGVDLTPFVTAPEILGALGGAVVELAVGSDRGAAPPLEVETLAGVSPDPFVTGSELAIAEARTRARVNTARSGTATVEMRFQVAFDGLPALEPTDVVATWEQAGGISPQPFVVAIPAGCFAPDLRGLRVEDFRACGARTELGGQALPLLELQAAMGVEPTPFVPDRVVLRIRAVMGVNPDPFAGAPVLGALGGAELAVAVGSASGGAPPLSVATVSGVEPVPF